MKAIVTAAITASALLYPATSSASATESFETADEITTSEIATPSDYPIEATNQIPVGKIGETCKRKERNYVVREYFRGPAKYTLRCGTARWGWKHIKKRHGWNKTMDKRIRAAIWSGLPNGRGGYSSYSNTCPPEEKFRTLIGTPAGVGDLLTAYTVNKKPAAEASLAEGQAGAAC
ncbi:hypothetical protein [Streptomyces alkaliterrae]|uniref:hypothetical protein n=1 Tax=Streptomyces alkaliterrae TaxID=2213162 RepID=UPI001E51F819|nr:hypothetical protein [Streptomyces alkaliterrae]